MAEIDYLIPKGKLGTPQTVVADLVHRVDEMQEIYAIVRYKDGTHQEYINGTLEGISFALLVLQNYALDAL